MRRIIVCGSRDWNDIHPIRVLLTGMAERWGAANFTVVHGAARGADEMAGVVCRSSGLIEEPHPADWIGQGRSAGPIRNRLMLELGVDQVWAFKDDFDPSMSRGGTENMVKIASEAGIPTYVVQRFTSG